MNDPFENHEDKIYNKIGRRFNRRKESDVID
jgi:hypothetical protein